MGCMIKSDTGIRVIRFAEVINQMMQFPVYDQVIECFAKIYNSIRTLSFDMQLEAFP